MRRAVGLPVPGGIEVWRVKATTAHAWGYSLAFVAEVAR